MRRTETLGYGTAMRVSAEVQAAGDTIHELRFASRNARAAGDKKKHVMLEAQIKRLRARALRRAAGN